MWDYIQPRLDVIHNVAENLEAVLGPEYEASILLDRIYQSFPDTDTPLDLQHFNAILDGVIPTDQQLLAFQRLLEHNFEYLSDIWTHRRTSTAFGQAILALPKIQSTEEEWSRFQDALRERETVRPLPEVEARIRKLGRDFPNYTAPSSSQAVRWARCSSASEGQESELFFSAETLSLSLGSGKGLSTEHAVKTLHAFLRRAWFQRVWVAQEYAVALNPTFVCGDIGVPWQLMESGLKCALLMGRRGVGSLQITMQQSPEDRTDFARHLFAMMDFRRRFWTGRSTMFSLLLSSSTYPKDSDATCLQSTKERDRVFAFRGLACDVGKGCLTPDYEGKDSEFLEKTTAWLLGHSGIDVLYLCRLRSRADYTPSWTPDFHIPMRRPLGLDTRFSAAGKTRPSYEKTGDRNGVSILNLVVIPVCQVDSVAPSLEDWWQEKTGSAIRLPGFEDQLRTLPSLMASIFESMDSDSDAGSEAMEETQAYERYMHRFQGKLAEAIPECSNRRFLGLWLNEVETTLSTDKSEHPETGKARERHLPIDFWKILVADSFSKQDVAGPDLDDLVGGHQPALPTARLGGLPLQNDEALTAEAWEENPSLRHVQERCHGWRPVLHGDSVASAYARAYESLKSPLGYQRGVLDTDQWSYQLNKLIEAQNRGRRVFRAGEFFGLGPDSLEAGDHVVIPLGSRVPFVVRPIDRDVYVVVGEAFVQGLMEGEFMRTLPEKKRICLV